MFAAQPTCLKSISTTTHTHTCTCLSAIFPGCITHHRNNWQSRLPVTHCTGNSASKIMTLRRYTNLFITISIKMLHNVTRVETNNSWQFLKNHPSLSVLITGPLFTLTKQSCSPRSLRNLSIQTVHKQSTAVSKCQMQSLAV